MASRTQNQNLLQQPATLEERAMDSFRARLEALVDMAGNANLLAKKSGVALSSLRHYLGGGEPTRPVLVALARAVGARVEWLVTGEGSPSDGEANGFSTDDGMVWIPRYEVRASAGGGTEVDSENVRGMVAFPREWVVNQLRVTDPTKLCLIEVEGDSMKPTLNPGDLVLVNRSDTHPRDGIFALHLDGALYVKRLQIIDEEHLEVRSDNSDYRSRRIPLREGGERTRILGRVVWADRKF